MMYGIKNSVGTIKISKLPFWGTGKGIQQAIGIIKSTPPQSVDTFPMVASSWTSPRAWSSTPLAMPTPRSKMPSPLIPFPQNTSTPRLRSTKMNPQNYPRGQTPPRSWPLTTLPIHPYKPTKEQGVRPLTLTEVSHVFTIDNNKCFIYMFYDDVYKYTFGFCWSQMMKYNAFVNASLLLKPFFVVFILWKTETRTR